MKMKQLTRMIAAATLACGTVGAAHAAHFVELQGATMNFFVDSDYFDISRTTVSGDSISFGLDPDRYSVSATGTRASSSNQDTLESPAGKALYIVAHDGYSIQSQFTSAATGDYLMTGAASGTNGYVVSHIFAGTNTGGVLASSPWLTTSANLRMNQYDTVSGGAVSYTQEAIYPSTELGDVWAVDTRVSLMVYQKGKSTSSMSLNQLSYSFLGIADGQPPVVTPPVIYPPIPGVPEPETYAMLLAGLALVGVARRRQA